MRHLPVCGGCVSIAASFLLCSLCAPAVAHVVALAVVLPVVLVVLSVVVVVLVVVLAVVLAAFLAFVLVVVLGVAPDRDYLDLDGDFVALVDVQGHDFVALVLRHTIPVAPL